MALLDGPVKAAVDAVLGVLGISVTLSRMSEAGNYDPITGSEGLGTASTAVFKASPPTRYKHNQVDGTRIRMNDLQIILATKDQTVVPDPATDTLLIAGVSYTIVDVESIYTGDEAAAYTLQIRR